MLVHGFTQTRRSWGPAAVDLARRFELVRVDAPGHGGSSEIPADVAEGARLIGEVGGRASYIGYSMGARLCLRLALDAPDVVRSLVLVSGTPGIEDDDERRRRRLEDDRLAAELERVGLDEFLHRWLSGPLFASLGPAEANLDARRENTVAGLATSLRLAGTGAQEPLWARLAELAMPVLVVAGARDHVFSDRAAAVVGAIGTNAELAVVPDAGHALHLERPAAFVALVDAFLSRSDTGMAGA
ncbi:MAG TPA: alpha/beta fold hydrolase [Acidimicrobiales bacterium]|nr:alpha/beta fold hydrolase [Acidimicrobiales bacterium]